MGPCGPLGPSPPAGPCGPAGPTEPCAPAMPVGPCGPTGPAEPVAPMGPASPVGPRGPGAPVGPTGPWAPVGPAGPDSETVGPPLCWLQATANGRRARRQNGTRRLVEPVVDSIANVDTSQRPTRFLKAQTACSAHSPSQTAAPRRQEHPSAGPGSSVSGRMMPSLPSISLALA